MNQQQSFHQMERPKGTSEPSTMFELAHIINHWLKLVF
jgi:hypothetical protein